MLRLRQHSSIDDNLLPGKQAMAPCRSGGARQQSRVVLWSVDIQSDQRIIYTNILDMFLMLMFDITGDRRGRDAKKRFHHFPAYKVGMTVLSRRLRHNCPDVLIGSFEGIAQRLEGRGSHRRAVN